MDKCREAFEKEHQDFVGFEKINLGLYDNKEYKNPRVREAYFKWRRAWNSSHDRCAEICVEKSEEVADISAVGWKIALECKSAIQKDKV